MRLPCVSRRRLWQWGCLAALVVVLASVAIVGRALPWRADASTAARIISAPTDDPLAAALDMLAHSFDEAVARILDAVLDGQRSAAVAALQALLERHPDFRAGHALLGDLLRTAAPQTPAVADEAALQALRHELAQRYRGARQRPQPEYVPAGIYVWGDKAQDVLLIDAHLSRLYWLRWHNGHAQIRADFYVSVGKAGVGKQREGDKKTPLGAYRITDKIAPDKLPAFYGSGALPLDYPNDWDRRNGRTGYGIWLHGTPPRQLSRPPESSDGCVVLANDDLRQLWQQPDIEQIPVLIVEKIEWLDAQRAAEEQAALRRSVAPFIAPQSVDSSAGVALRWRDLNGETVMRILAYDRAGAKGEWIARVEGERWQMVSARTQQWSVAKADNNGAEWSDEHRVLQARLQAWARAWQARDVDAYLGFYIPDGSPVEHLARAEWEAQRRQAILGKSAIRIDVELLDMVVQNDTARMRMRQHYRADGKSLRTNKFLLWRKDNERWLIAQERVS